MATSKLPMVNLISDPDDSDDTDPNVQQIAAQASVVNPNLVPNGPVAGDQGAQAQALQGLSPDFSDAAIKTKLADARANQNQFQQLKAINHLGAALGGLGRGITVKPDDTLYDEQQKQAMDPVADLGLREKNEQELGTLAKQQTALKVSQDAQDPDSSVSHFFQDALKQMGLNVNNIDQLSASDIEAGMGPIEKYLSAQQVAELRRLTAQDRAAKSSDAQSHRDEVQVNNDFMKLGKQINEGVASSRSALGQAALVQNKGARINALIDQTKNQPGGADPRQMAETAKQLDAMLAGGVGTITGSQDLLPKSAQGKYASLQEFFTNAPVGTDMGAFLQRTQDTVNREISVAQNQQHVIQRKLVQGYEHLRKKDPERFNDILNTYSLNDSGSTASTSSGGDASGYIPTQSEAQAEIARRKAAKNLGQ